MSAIFNDMFIEFEANQNQMVQGELVKTKNINIQNKLEINSDYRRFLHGRVRILRRTI